MKQRIAAIALCAALTISTTTRGASCSSCHSGSSSENSVVTAFFPRSQGYDKVMQMVGSTNHVHLLDREPWYGELSLSLEYTQSFRAKKLAQKFFGTALVPFTTPDACGDCSDQMIVIQGCGVANRNPNALVADNFFLPSDFSSRVTVNPKIRNINANIDFYIGLDPWLCGAYLRLHGPICHSRWNMHLDETVIATGGTIAPGILTPGDSNGTTPIARPALYENFAEYVGGNRDLGTVDTVTFRPLGAGRISQCERTRTGFADLRAELGWNFVQSDYYHVGFNIQAAAPTGTKRNADFLFDALLGNDKAELGFGVTGHYTFWCNEAHDHILSLHVDMNLSHLFKSRERRVFDLRNKPLSRYLMASKFTTPAVELTIETSPDNFTPPPSQFMKEFSPVANLTARDVDITVGLQTDLVFLINHRYCNWNIDWGYNFWGRSCEKIKEDCECTNNPLLSAKWALRGNAQMFGYAGTDGEDEAGALPAIPLSATQSAATITSCIPNSETVMGITTINTGIDSPLPAFNAAGVAPLRPAIGDNTNIINTSIRPEYILPSSVNFGAPTRGMSHKLFAQVAYEWDDAADCWLPYVGIGAFVEWGVNSKSSCLKPSPSTTVVPQCGDNCVDCSLSQWSVWVKLGVSFS